jgi:hypothetical protein
MLFDSRNAANNQIKCDFGRILGFDVSPDTMNANEIVIQPVGPISICVFFPKALGITSKQALESYLMKTVNNWGLSIFYVLEEPAEWLITDEMESAGSATNLKTKLLELVDLQKGNSIIEITNKTPISEVEMTYWQQITPN